MFVVIFDQATKFSILAFLSRGDQINVFHGLNFVLTFNFGTSFGLISPQTMMQYYMVILLTVVCIIAISYMYLKTTNAVERILCSLVIGGAIGNLFDRFFHGAVVDFIDVYYKNSHWPAFNVADSFISVSVIVLIFYNLFMVKK